MQRTNGLPIDEDVRARIEEFARLHGTTPADVVRIAFERYEHAENGGGRQYAPFPNGESLYDRLLRAGVIGVIDDPDLPTDLSTNKKHFEDFGLD